jgi:hypothetical protein
MDTHNSNLPVGDGEDSGPNSQSKRGKESLLWPWLILIGLLAIGYGMIGVLVG